MTKFQKSYIIVTNPEDLGDLFCWPDFCHFWSDNYRWECSNPAFRGILPSVSEAFIEEAPHFETVSQFDVRLCRGGIPMRWQPFLSFRGTTCRGIPALLPGCRIGETRWNGTLPLQWMILWMWLWPSLYRSGWQREELGWRRFYLSCRANARHPIEKATRCVFWVTDRRDHQLLLRRQ